MQPSPPSWRLLLLDTMALAAGLSEVEKYLPIPMVLLVVVVAITLAVAVVPQSFRTRKLRNICYYFSFWD
jgi:hypothetical protein